MDTELSLKGYQEARCLSRAFRYLPVSVATEILTRISRSVCRATAIGDRRQIPARNRYSGSSSGACRRSLFAGLPSSSVELRPEKESAPRSLLVLSSFPARRRTRGFRTREFCSRFATTRRSARETGNRSSRRSRRRDASSTTNDARSVARTSFPRSALF